MATVLRFLFVVPLAYVAACLTAAFAMLWPFVDFGEASTLDPFMVAEAAFFFGAQAVQIGTVAFLPWLDRSPVKSIRYKDTVSRWGSCSSEGNLSFSWRIMMAPRPVIDYLVAHEVAHLVHMNHGPKFWALCEELCPDTKRCKAWLKKNGSALQAIGF